MFCTWALTDSLSDIVTPRTVNVATRVIPGRSGEGVNCRFRLVVQMISTDLLQFSVKLLSFTHASTLFSSLDLMSTLLAGTMIYTVSQKNYTDVTHYRFNPHQLISVIFGRDVAERVFIIIIIIMTEYY